MADEQNFSLKEAYQKIRNLMDQERWQEAHRACLEILKYDPENIKVIRLMKKIEKAVEDINTKIIKEDIANLKELWDKQEYEELVTKLRGLKKYSKTYPPLLKELEKAEKAYQKQLHEEQVSAFDEERKKIDEYIANQKFADAMRATQKLRITRIRENEIKKLLNKIRKMWVEHELKRQQGLLSSKKFEEILLALQQIQSIDPHSDRIKKIIDNVKKKYQRYKVDEKKDFIYKGLEKTRTLIQLKKYDKAVQAAHEILEIDPDNDTARKLFRRAKTKLGKSINKDLLKQMKNSREEIKEDMKTAKKGKYVKI